MRSLFVRFFLSFLLIILLFAGIGIGLTLLRDREFPPETHQLFARQMVREYGQEAIDLLEREGEKSLHEYIRRLDRQRQVQLALFDASGRPIGDGHLRIPRRMRMLARRALSKQQLVLPMMGEHNLVASPVRGPSGRSYAVSISLHERPKPEQLLKVLGHGFFNWRLLILLSIAALVCLWLARSFSAPIRRLRQATRRLAAGDLSSRVGEQVSGKHELAGLARDFDHMAARIEDLVAAQQRLLRDISHELRSPLARLGVALELARQETDPQRQEKSLQRIEKEAQRMNQMIGQLLSLTRLESGDQELQRSHFDLDSLVSELVRDADFEARNRNCQVSLADNGPCPFYGSQQLLARALENVIRNAIKYTAEGSEVKVELQQQTDQIRLRVLDQGPGVPEAALEKLFEPFYRVAEARDRQSGGTGIGLAIAERAVKLHAGSIRALNRVEGGLLIEICLPKNMN